MATFRRLPLENRKTNGQDCMDLCSFPMVMESFDKIGLKCEYRGDPEVGGMV